MCNTRQSISLVDLFRLVAALSLLGISGTAHAYTISTFDPRAFAECSREPCGARRTEILLWCVGRDAGSGSCTTHGGHGPDPAPRHFRLRLVSRVTGESVAATG